MNQNSPKTLLLVEDEAILAMLETMTLQSFGYTVLHANTGEKALELLADGAQIDLVLMDINLGSGIDGTQAARAILARREVPIVFLTAHSEREMVEKVRHITRYGYVLKDAGAFVLQTSIEMAFELFEAHQKTRQVVEDLKKAQQVANVGNWSWRPLSGEMEWSDEMYHIFGYAKETFAGKLEDIFAQAVHPEDRARVEEARRQVIQERRSGGIEYRILWPDGSLHSVYGEDVELRLDEQGNPVYITGIVMDITTRHQALQALRSSEAKYRALFENSLDAIIIGAPDGSIIGANSAACRLLGWTEAELLRLKRADIMDLSDPRLAYGLEERRRTGKYLGALTYLRKDGSRFDGEISSVLFQDQDGREMTAGIIRDVTERRQAEQKIQQSLKEKDLLLREVHHRVKNHLTAIRSLLLLQAGDLADPSGAEALHEAAGRVVGIQAVYDRLVRQEDYELLDLHDYLAPLLAEIVSSWSRPGHSIALLQQVDAIQITVKKAFPLALVLNEWLTNACKHAFPAARPGHIRVTVQRSESGWITASVSDDGVGLPGQVDIHQPQTFGLLLVNAMAGQLGGTLQVQRSNGTAFQLDFPVE
jgi:two-component system, sensor histidine kinase PdtaS